MKKLLFLLLLLFIFISLSCENGGEVPFVFLDPEVTTDTWKEGNFLVVAATVDANPFSGFANETQDIPLYFWGYTVECYDSTTDDGIGEANGASEVTAENSIIASMAGEFQFPYAAGDITTGDTIVISVTGSIGVGREADVIAYSYNFEEVVSITAP